MSATTDIYVTPSTSLILIRNVSSPTNIYLSTFYTPNFQVSVRDTTGSSTIRFSTVTLSTIGSARFTDGSFSYTLNQPYGFVNVGFRNSSFWQVLHTSGQVPATAAADVGKLNVSTSYIGLLSTLQKNVSSLVVENLTTTNAILIDSPFIITNLSAPGIVTVRSTFTVYGDVTIDKQLFVSGGTSFLSSLRVLDILPISSYVHVSSFVGVGGSLSVGGLLTIGSTLFTGSTNTLETLQVQKSTTDITTSIQDTFQSQNLLSTLLSLTVTNSFFTSKQMTIEQNLSSLANTVSTQSLSVGYDVFGKGAVSANTAFFSTLNGSSTLQVLGSMDISTGLTVNQNLLVSSLSTLSFSTLSSLSTAFLVIHDSATFQGSFSTLSLDILSSFSVGSLFQTVATVSSLGPTSIRDTLFVRGATTFDFVYVSSLVEANELFVSSSVSTNSILFEGGVSTLGYLYAKDVVSLTGNLGVANNMFVQSNVTVPTGASEISSFFVNSFLLSNLHILTSSPFVALRASTLIASTIQTIEFLIGETEPSYFLVGSTFASTTQINTATGENIRFNTAIASNFSFGYSTNSNVSFFLDAKSYFPKGISAQTIKVNSLTADFISSAFLGDGIGVSNVAMPYAHVSVVTALASSISTSVLYSSSLATSSFTNLFQTIALSTFISPTLAIEGIGFPMRFDKNQILVINSNLYAVNRGLYIDTLQNRVGVNISTPQVDLDISGGLYPYGGIIYSSINDMYVSSQASPLILSTLFTANVFVRDRFLANVSSGYSLVNLSVDSNKEPIRTFLIQEKMTPDSSESNYSSFGLFSYPSSISLMDGVFITNDTQRVGVNSFSNNIFTEPPYELSLTSNLVGSNGYASSIHSFGGFQAGSFVSPSLYIHATPNISVNTLSTTGQKLFMDVNLLTLVNDFPPRMGIKQTNPGATATQATLDITGSAYFSTISLINTLVSRTIRLGSLEL
jgi:hypothetical protein